MTEIQKLNNLPPEKKKLLRILSFEINNNTKHISSKSNKSEFENALKSLHEITDLHLLAR